MPKLKETMVYDKKKGSVKCGICGQRCELSDGQRGLCKVRKNVNGTLYSLVYGKAIDIALDPIEKKPFFHFAPGSRALSVATMGCNLGCLFCQNWSISQDFDEIEGQPYSPKDLVKKAKNWKCKGIAYTYTEPAVFYEYVYDTARETDTTLYNVLVTNGYFTPESLEKISRHIEAANVDLKGGYSFYKKYCLGKQGDGPVKETLKILKEKKIWTEITTLLIPGLNDDEARIKTMCRWILDNLGDVPLHFSRFYPNYKMADRKPTPVETLEKAWDIAKKEGLNYVYVGNVPGHEHENTFCHGCGNAAIKRSGFALEEFNLDKNFRCVKCGEKVPVAGKNWIDTRLFRK